jgi:hypothetical protein
MMADMMAQMQKLLAPSLAFHATNAAANKHDVRFLWEVKIIQGADEFFGQVSGVSTMPGLLEPAHLHRAVGLVSDEMTSKIVLPVVGKFQDLVNDKALEDHQTPDNTARRVGESLPPLLGDEPEYSEADLDVEAAVISAES